MRTLEKLGLFLSFFNKVLADALFLVKLTMLSIVILGGFSTIRLAHSNSILASVYFVLAFNSAVVYISIFQLAFQITENVEDLKNVIEVKFSSLPFPWARKYLERIISSTPVLAIKVGGFHAAEQESVPIFLDFVVKQIVNLLLTL